MPFLFGLDRVPYQIGVWLGSAARGATDEALYLKHRTGSATARERASWIRRCVLSCLLVAGETVLLINIGTIVGSPATLVVGWTTVLLLPKLTPRLPLFYARWLAMIFTVANMGSSFHWLKTRFPATVEPWGEIVGILGFFAWIGLCVWAFLAFRRPALQKTAAPRSEPLKTRPGLPLRVVGGAKHVKGEALTVMGQARMKQEAVEVQREYVVKRDGGYYVAGSRVSLASIIYEYRDGAPTEAIRQNFPTLSLEQIHGAIAFYLRHQEEAEAYLRELERKWEALERAAKPASPKLQQRLDEARKRLLAKQA